MSCGNCDGRCCSIFNYPHTPEFLKFRHESLNGYPDDKMLSEMLVRLTPKEAIERAEKFGVVPPRGMTREQWAEKTGPVYTCKHWDEETRLCTVYDKRPQMCRDYPYGKRCQHGCGYALPQAHPYHEKNAS